MLVVGITDGAATVVVICMANTSVADSLHTWVTRRANHILGSCSPPTFRPATVTCVVSLMWSTGVPASASRA
jgi:hypothetical protein